MKAVLHIDNEPTDLDLQLLMKDVMTSVKQKAEKANLLFYEKLHNYNKIKK